MNLEFQATGRSTMAGLRGMSGPENPSTSQSSGHENSAQFKDLLNQSKQTINQADHHLEKVRKNQREAKSIAENNRRQSDQTSLKDDAVTTADDQVEEPKEAELKSDEGQQSSSLSTLDSAQLMAIQSFQGGIETAQTRLNLKLGIQGVEEPEAMGEQGQMLVLAGKVTKEEMLIFQQNTSQMESENQVKIDGDPEIVKGVKPEQASVQTSDNEGDQSLKKENQIELGDEFKFTISTDSRRQMFKQVEAVRPVLTEIKFSEDAEPEIAATTFREDTEPKMAARTFSEDVEPEIAITEYAEPGLVDDISKITGGVAKNEERSGEESDDKRTLVSDVLEKAQGQIGDQNLEKMNSREVNMAAVNSNKSAEVQATNKTEVAQQVQQKILQNFEPNKPTVFQMTLSPDNLGDIDVKLSYDQGKLIIDIMAVSQETQKLLGKQINQLVRGLALQNVQVETVHLNTPVEQSGDSQNAAFMMNNGSDPNQNQNQALLRERFIKSSGVLNSITTNGDEDESVLIPQNLQNYTNHRVNYLI